LQVVFVGPKKPSPSDALLCSRVGVNRPLLRECLDLLLTSPQYATVFGGGEMPCSLDEKALAKYPENGVPESIMSTLIHTQDLAADRRDSAGYTQQEQHDDTAPSLRQFERVSASSAVANKEAKESELDPEDDMQLGDDLSAASGSSQPVNKARKTAIAVQLGGVVDVDATSLTIDQLQNAFKNQGKGKDVALCMPRSSKFANDYSQDFWAGAFFDLYPWCEGTVADKRDVRLSPTEYAQHVMNIADPRFRQHAVFPFALFNVTQRHQVLSSTSQSVRMGTLLEMRKHLAYLTGPVLKQALRDLEQAERQNGFATLESVEDDDARSALKNMLHQLNTISGRLPLSNKSKRAARFEIHALIQRFDAPDWWITINPSDLHSPLAIHFTGVTIDFGDDDSGFPTGLPSAAARRILAAQNPVAGARFGFRLLDAFIKCLLNFRLDPADYKDPADTSGILGKTRAHAFNPEHTDRGTVHFHGFVWLKHKPSPLQFRALMSNPDFRKRLLRYLDSVIQQQSPALEVPLDVSYPPCAIDSCKGKPAHAVSKHIRQDNNTDKHVSCWRPPRTTAARLAQDLRADLPLLVATVQEHHHSFTCDKYRGRRKKGKNQRRESMVHGLCRDLDFRECRFLYPKRLIDVSDITDNGDIELKRECHWQRLQPNYHVPHPLQHGFQAFVWSRPSRVPVLRHRLRHQVRIRHTHLVSNHANENQRVAPNTEQIKGRRRRQVCSGHQERHGRKLSQDGQKPSVQDPNAVQSRQRVAYPSCDGFHVGAA
jgi:hypothetical protein